MKKLSIFLLAFMLVFGMLNSADALTLLEVDGAWTSVTGGKYIKYNNGVNVSYGNESEDQIRWGSAASNSGQSGLGFTGAESGLAFDIGEIFEIGQLRHYNNPIYSGSAATNTSLSISLSFAEPIGLTSDFEFIFDIDETPNSYGDYRDNDIITFPQRYASNTFTIGSMEYTLELLGFGDSVENIKSAFSSPEGGTNATILWGKITASENETVPTPEPSSFLLLGMGLFGLAAYTRKQSKK